MVFFLAQQVDLKLLVFFILVYLSFLSPKVTRRVDVAAMKRMISSRTALLVGSAPQFPHGSIDPIGKLSACLFSSFFGFCEKEDDI